MARIGAAMPVGTPTRMPTAIAVIRRRSRRCAASRTLDMTVFCY
jgi:hypothetical protein